MGKKDENSWYRPQTIIEKISYSKAKQIDPLTFYRNLSQCEFMHQVYIFIEARILNLI